MNKEQAIAKLKDIQRRVDTPPMHEDQETWHWEADQVLCELLKSLGYEDVVTEWYEIPKWYA